MTINYIGTIAKAIAGAATAFGAAFALAQADGITSGEWVTIGIATLVAAAAVWATPNSASSEA